MSKKHQIKKIEFQGNWIIYHTCQETEPILNVIEITVDTKSFRCQDCGENLEFMGPKLNEVEIKNFICCVCEKSFYSGNELTICPRCEETFRKKSNSEENN